MTIRKLKVESVGEWGGYYKPKIRLMGKWLDEAGFKPNSQVEIEVHDGALTIRPVKEEQI